MAAVNPPKITDSNTAQNTPGVKNEMDINKQETDYKNNRLNKQTIITSSRLTNPLKYSLILLQLAMKGLGRTGKFRNCHFSLLMG